MLQNYKDLTERQKERIEELINVNIPHRSAYLYVISNEEVI